MENSYYRRNVVEVTFGLVHASYSCLNDFLCTLIKATFLFVSKIKMTGMPLKLRKVNTQKLTKHTQKRSNRLHNYELLTVRNDF